MLSKGRPRDLASRSSLPLAFLDAFLAVFEPWWLLFRTSFMRPYCNATQTNCDATQNGVSLGRCSPQSVRLMKTAWFLLVGHVCQVRRVGQLVFVGRHERYVQNGVRSRRFAIGVLSAQEAASSPAGRVDGGLIFQRATTGQAFQPDRRHVAAGGPLERVPSG